MLIAALGDAESRRQEGPRSHDGQILVIDDDDDLRELVARRPQRESATAWSPPRDGPAGVAAYHAHQPDLVVLDIGLGAMDGLEVCRQLRATGNTPIVFLTSRADEVDQLVGFAAGADDYVTKPFSPDCWSPG